MTNHIKRMKNKNFMILPVAAEKANKIQYPFVGKSLNRLGIET
jgi:hypothetical protein